jgi:phage gpG-like protein
MSESKIELKGFDDFFSRLKEAPNKFKENADKAIQLTALQIRSRVVEGIASQKWKSSWAPLSPKYLAFKMLNKGSNKILISGIRSRVRKRTNDTKPLKKVLLGNYRNSFMTQKIENAVYAVGSNYPQARALELGNPSKKMPARPHLKFAVEESKEDLFKNVMKAMKESL